MASKEFGKLTGDQFAELISFVPTLLLATEEMGDRLSQTPTSRFDEVMSSGFGGYSHVYEKPF